MAKPTITVRMTPELHERLKNEAYIHGVSMNQWCIAALEYAIKEGFVASPDGSLGVVISGRATS